MPVVARVSTQFPTQISSDQLTSNWLKPALTQLNSHKMIFFRKRRLEMGMRRGQCRIARAPSKTKGLRCHRSQANTHFLAPMNTEAPSIISGPNYHQHYCTNFDHSLLLNIPVKQRITGNQDHLGAIPTYSRPDGSAPPPKITIETARAAFQILRSRCRRVQPRRQTFCPKSISHPKQPGLIIPQVSVVRRKSAHPFRGLLPVRFHPAGRIKYV
jgi:hypothetical protein